MSFAPKTSAGLSDAPDTGGDSSPDLVQETRSELHALHKETQGQLQKASIQEQYQEFLSKHRTSHLNDINKTINRFFALTEDKDGATRDDDAALTKSGTNDATQKSLQQLIAFVGGVVHAKEALSKYQVTLETATELPRNTEAIVAQLATAEYTGHEPEPTKVIELTESPERMLYCLQHFKDLDSTAQATLLRRRSDLLAYLTEDKYTILDISIDPVTGLVMIRIELPNGDITTLTYDPTTKTLQTPQKGIQLDQ